MSSPTDFSGCKKDNTYKCCKTDSDCVLDKIREQHMDAIFLTEIYPDRWNLLSAV